MRSNASASLLVSPSEGGAERLEAPKLLSRRARNRFSTCRGTRCEDEEEEREEALGKEENDKMNNEEEDEVWGQGRERSVRKRWREEEEI